MKLQTKLDLGILLIFSLLATGISLMTLYWSNNTTIKQARNRVARNINSAWLIYNGKLEQICLTTQFLAATIAKDTEIRASKSLSDKLEVFCQKNNLDILDLLDSQAKVITRSRKPHNHGESLLNNIIVKKALLTGKVASGTILIPAAQLEREGKDLVERCQSRGGNSTGMFMGTAVPVISRKKVEAVLLAGVLLNGAVEKVDKIRDLVFEGKLYKGKPVGTATIFMKDLRISTNVTDGLGNRAIGTKVSSEVAEHVLKKGLSWTGRAKVVDAWYISQYDPIRNPDGDIIGMLYVGELEQKYIDIGSKTLMLQLSIIFAVMALAFVVIFLMMRNVLRPIEELSYTTQKFTTGDFTSRIEVKTKDEVGKLCESFNYMAEQLQKQRSEIKKRQITLENLNTELKTKNRNYMEMLGFVSHELKNPLASATMGLFTVKDEYIGKLNPLQKKSLGSVANSLNYFQDMIKNYLDLSRLEKGELIVNKTNFVLLKEVLVPVLVSLQPELRQKKMTLKNHIPEEVELNADKNLLRIVYDNLLSNAIKYGRKNGKIELNFERGEKELILNVYNEGEGIPKDKLPMLFQKFSRIDDPKYAAKKGTGLGLYICKEIVQKHGGEIRAESKQGKWTKFTFTLPIN